MYLPALRSSSFPSLWECFPVDRGRGERAEPKQADFSGKAFLSIFATLIKLSLGRDLKSFKSRPVKTIKECVKHSSGPACRSSNWRHLINPQALFPAPICKAQPGPISDLLFLEINYMFRQRSGGESLRDCFSVLPHTLLFGGGEGISCAAKLQKGIPCA